MSTKVAKDEIDKMVELYQNGMSCKEIGDVIGRNCDTVRRNLKKRNVYVNNTNYMSGNELSLLIEDYKNGLKIKDLAEKYNRTSGYIIGKLKSADVFKPINTRIPKYDLQRIKDLYENGDLDSIFNSYPNMTMASLHAKMSKYSVRSGRVKSWTKEELEYLKDNYFNKDLCELEEIFNYRHSVSGIQTKALRKFGYSTKNDWSNEENELLIKLYPTMPLNDICDKFPKRSKDAISIHARSLGHTSAYILDSRWTSEEAEYLFKNWEMTSDYDMSIFLNKPQCAVKGKRLRMNLLRIIPDFKNYESINKLLRGKIWEWKSKSMENCNYQCIITGSKDFQIHHIYPFNRIIDDIFNDNNIEYKPLEEYSDVEIEEIIELFIAEHNKYPLGVCIRTDIHNLYHSLYGKTDNNIVQWNKFIEDLKTNKYKDLITL